MPANLPTNSPATAPRGKLTQSLRRRLAALSVVGAMMVALPVLQVLRFQAEQIEVLVKQQTSLNPFVRATQVQRGVLAHGGLAGQVLAGELALEPQRLQQQHSVQAHAQALVTELELLHMARARAEAQSLQRDFAALTPQIAARSITPAASKAAHRLLVEQALQVMDFCDELVHAPVGTANTSTLHTAWAVLRHTPRRALVLRETARPAEANAQWLPFDQARAQIALALADDIQHARRQRELGLALLGVLAFCAGTLVLSLWRGLLRIESAQQRTVHPDAQDQAEQAPVNGPEETAGRLMQQLRQGEAPMASAPPRGTWSDTAPLP